LGRPFLLLLLLGAVVAVLVWRPRGGPPPNVLLITIDTLRADALVPGDTPAILELAARGARFVRVRAPAPLTLPSHATILSGLAPVRHGIRDNTAVPLADASARGFPLLAEEFQGAGYATAAFVASAVLDPRYGLDAGFEAYRHPSPRPGVPGFPARDASEQVDRARAWLAARRKDRPYFLWVHLWEPHAPYRPYAGDPRRSSGSVEDDPAAERYRGEVCKADWAVEELLKSVDAEDTIVVVTSDHGESLGAHDESTHGFLCYGVTLDVPLVLAGPGISVREDAGLRALADIAPTLRRLCRLPTQPGDGLDLFSEADGRVVVSESLYANRVYGWAQQTAATDGAFSLVVGGPRLELFSLFSDPSEREPIADPERPEAYERLDRPLRAHQRITPGGSAGDPLSPAHTPYGAMRRSGTLFLEAAENRRLPDVRARLIPTLRALNSLDAAIARGQEALVRRFLPEVARLEAADPANPALPFARGRAELLVLKSPAEAARLLRRACDLGYDSADALKLLESAYAAAGDAEGLAWTRAYALRKNRGR